MTPPTNHSPLFSIHPLPWKIFQEPGFRGGEIKITDCNGLIVFGEGSFGQESKFYSFIVQAVNTHAAALECVEALKRIINIPRPREILDPRKIAYERGSQALAKWEEANK